MSGDHHAGGRLAALAAIVFVAGCGLVDPSATASLGGAIAGDRGRVQVVFINNTPYQAVFTFGTYSPADQTFPPEFGQFVLDASGTTLLAGASSDVVPLACARVLSLGSPDLLASLRETEPATPLDEGALVAGVEFFERDSTGTTAKAAAGSLPTITQNAEASVGGAAPFEARLGVDFPCGSLLIVRFELDDAASTQFRIDFELIPSESTR